MSGELVAIIAIVCFCLLAAFKHYLRSDRARLSAADRQLIESLRNHTVRLEQRVDVLERALLDAEAGYARRGTEV